MHIERNASPIGRETVSVRFTVGDGVRLDVDLHTGKDVVQGAAACAIGHCNAQADTVLGRDTTRPRCGLTITDVGGPDSVEEAYDVACEREPDCMRTQLGEPDTLDVMERMAKFAFRGYMRDYEVLTAPDPAS
jgi:hypothetical protein